MKSERRQWSDEQKGDREVTTKDDEGVHVRLRSTVRARSGMRAVDRARWLQGKIRLHV